MACFLVPAGEAVVTTIAAEVLKRYEVRHPERAQALRVSASRKAQWLSNLLWGGSALLAYEHLWHGEVQPFFPFLTAAENPEALALALQEMSTTGVSMAALVTAVWALMVAFSGVVERRVRQDRPGGAA